jgi:copper resistance protein C
MSATTLIPRRRVLLAAALTATAGALAIPGPRAADAHTSVKSARPAAGSTSKTTISVVAVIFNGEVRSASIAVKGPDRKTVSKKTVRDPRNDHRFQTSLKRGLKAGAYRATWTITAADGHRQTGTWTFRLKG